MFFTFFKLYKWCQIAQSITCNCMLVVFSNKIISSTSPILMSFWTLSRRRPLSYRNQSIDLLCKSMDWLDWFLYDNGLRHERVNYIIYNILVSIWHLHQQIMKLPTNALREQWSDKEQKSCTWPFINLTLYFIMS